MGTFAASAQASPTITEYTSGLSSDAGLHGIAHGPDGALWFTEADKGRIGRISTSGAITEFSSGIGGSDEPRGIAAGADGNLWFTESGSSAIGRITPGGSVTEYSSGLSGGSQPWDIVAGPDGNLWFTERANPGRIGRIHPGTGAITEYTIPTANSAPEGIAAGPDGNLWFTESANPGRIGRIVPGTGAITEFPTPTANSSPRDIAAGADGNLYFTEFNNPGAIGMIDPATGAILEFTTGLTPSKEPLGIAAGQDGALWFVESHAPGAVGRIGSSGAISEFSSGLTANLGPTSIASGPDGNLWFTMSASPARIARITAPPGAVTEAGSTIDDASVTLAGTVRPNSQSTTYYFQYGPTAAYGAQTAPAFAGSSVAAQSVTAPVGGLRAGSGYHFRVVASNGSGTSVGSDRVVTTAAAPGGSPSEGIDAGGSGDTGTAFEARPEMGRTVVAKVTKGTVMVKVPGTARFVSLDSAASVPAGSIFDARKGAVEVVSSLSATGTASQAATFWSGMFEVRQSRSGKGMVDIHLRGRAPGRCRKTSRASAAAAARKPAPRRLWGKDSRGRYRTHGRNSVATVRGTRWLTEDRCDGTLTRVTEGNVLVRDLKRHRSVLVARGHRYLARAAR